jgi:hypothetical protein
MKLVSCSCLGFLWVWSAVSTKQKSAGELGSVHQHDRGRYEGCTLNAGQLISRYSATAESFVVRFSRPGYTFTHPLFGT